MKNHRTKPRRITHLLILLFIILLAGIGFYARFIEPYTLTTDTADFHTDSINYTTLPSVRYDGSAVSAASGTSELTIAIFADTHFADYYTPENFSDVVSRINSYEPDLVFFLGDLVDDFSTYSGDIEEIERELASINSHIGKYAVYGNHDYGGAMEFDYPQIMEAGGFTLLINEYITFDNLNIGILGIDDMIIGYGDPSSASQLNDSYYNIVLCHEPDVIDKLLKYDIDLMFSGHTHGRQIDLRLFDNYILPQYGKKYIKGEFDFDNARSSRLYVTSGIGMTKLPLRYGTPPEINIIKISGN